MDTKIKVGEAQTVASYMIELRRYFHQHPEPSLKEYETAKTIKRHLNELNIPYVTVGETGVLATIKGNHPGKTLLMRADIDALEITDAKQTDYHSLADGYMHACGHDAHTASLLGAAKLLVNKKDQIHGTLLLAFQQAEEIGVGAKLFVDAGHLDHVDGVFGYHVATAIELGKLAINEGPVAASCDIFKIKLNGLSSHVGKPHQGIDAVYAASSLVVELQSIVSREVDPLQPAVVGIGILQSGTRYNIVANEASIEGTIRAFNQDVRKQIKDAITRITNHVCLSHRIESSIEFYDAASPVINHPEATKLAREIACNIVPSEHVLTNYELQMGADDFSEFQLKAPGVYVWVGTRNEDPATHFGHHHELFDIDEQALLIAAQLYIDYALAFLS